MSKYDKIVLDVLSDKKIKSTNEVVKEAERVSGQSVNWHMIYRILLELSHAGKVEKLEAKVGFFWKKKKL